MIKLGLLFCGNYFKYTDNTYQIVGVSHHRNYNNVLCINVNTNKRRWFDMDTEVEEVIQ